MNPPEALKRPPALPGWLAICFGLVGLTEPTMEPFSEREEIILPKQAAPQKPAKPRKPPTDWRKLPLVKAYTLVTQIGKGGFSEIWLAQHLTTGEHVALKVVQLACADLEPDEVATLLAEAKLLRTLDCPYLVGCRDTAATRDWLVLVLEHITGGEMLDHLHKVRRYSEAEAARLFAQIVSAVSYLHNLNVIHRDIKPENVMFTHPVEACEAEGRPLRVKLIDLGMAALYDPDKPIVGCVGTPGFVAPEVWNGQPHTPAMDVYSLGVVLFIMLTGRKPHSGMDIRRMTYCNKSIRDAPGLQDERFLSLSPSARELLLSMLADDPRVRPSCRAVLRHPFITAVDSSAEAHREMGEVVRRRMRDLARIRKLHGLRYAMHAQRPPGASQQAFLQVLEQRRLRLAGDSAPSRDSTASGGAPDGPGPGPRCSLAGSYEEGPAGGATTTAAAAETTGAQAGEAAGGGGVSDSRRGSGRGGGTGAGGGIFGRIRGSGKLGPGGGGGGCGQAKAKTTAGGCAGGGGGGGGGALPDKLALLGALPDTQHCSTMPPVRLAGWAPALSPVPSSCDPSASTYSGLPETPLPRGWSAQPIMYEALAHREALMGALAPGGDRGGATLGVAAAAGAAAGSAEVAGAAGVVGTQADSRQPLPPGAGEPRPGEAAVSAAAEVVAVVSGAEEEEEEEEAAGTAAAVISLGPEGPPRKGLLPAAKTAAAAKHATAAAMDPDTLPMKVAA